MIWLEGIRSHRASLTVLDNVTLGVLSGEIVVVLGKAASGKTTLLRIAAQNIRPHEGAIWFANKNLASLQRASLPFVRRNIGYFAEAPDFLEADTVLENLLSALSIRGESPVTASQKALFALELCQATALANRRVGTLSPRQRRNIGLARALAGPPPFIVLDEPALIEDEWTVLLKALAWAKGENAAILCATANQGLAETLVQLGARKVLLEEGRLAGAPSIGLVPAPSERTPVELSEEGDFGAAALTSLPRMNKKESL